ncbi:hypothetical protein [Streptococcus plurextorum]|uniref:hypothetical protein n=1 Tax=Streptococcus plurextorum TaxID=456876 RepID=UPI000410E678|nr:hypothetical protein [Streptococcus plurextorum]
MDKRNFLVLTFGTLLASTILTACSSNQSTQNKLQNLEDVTTVAFMQLANESKEHIWYNIDDSNDDGQISKDDSIDAIYITKNGKINTYFIRELTLSDVKDKNTEEVKKLAIEQDKAYFEVNKEDAIPSSGDKEAEKAEYYNQLIASWERTIEQIKAYPEEFSDPDLELSLASDELTKLKEEKDRTLKSLAELKKLTYADFSAQHLNKPAKATVKTDSTGNTVVGEAPEFWFYRINQMNGEVEVVNYNYYCTTTISGLVYNTYYVGYVNPDEGVNNDSFLITAVPNESVLIAFDKLDTKNVTEE